MVKCKKKHILEVATLLCVSLPAIAFAQPTYLGTPLEKFAVVVGSVIGILLPAASALVMVFFFYGLAVYALNSGKEEDAKKGKSIMIYGLLAAFIVLSLSGVVFFLQSVFGIEKVTDVGNFGEVDLPFHPTPP